MYKEINDFTLNIKTIKNHEELLTYMNSGFYSSIKLLISISSVFSIYWKVILPFIVSLGFLLILSSIQTIGKELEKFLDINFILAIFLSLCLLTLVFITHSKKYFLSCMEKSKKIIEKNKV